MYFKVKKQKPEIFFENNHIARDEGSMKNQQRANILEKSKKNYSRWQHVFI